MASIVHIPFYVSDWLGGTRGLSDAETGVFITLIMQMYAVAGPVERNDERLFRLCGSKSKRAFVQTLEHLIAEGKIEETEDGLYNQKVHEVLQEVTGKSEKAREAALSRWEKSRSNKKRKAKKAEEAQKEELEKPAVANELSEAVRVYNEAAARRGWPAVQTMNPARSSGLKARLSDCGGVEGWRHALDLCEASDFLSGRSGKWGGFSFDWIRKQSNFTKVMEGNYNNERSNTTSSTGGTAGTSAADERRRRIIEAAARGSTG